MMIKAAKGECEKIVARDPTRSAVGPTRLHGDEDVSWPTHMSPALDKLDHPVVLASLRTSFEFLDTLRLHHCENCNEQWPVFDGTWPQGGVATAGDKAGFSETIRQVGWDAARKDPSLCHRCKTSKVHRAMFSKANRQHLGDRHPAMSNLTWYESLLVARVHPVISVVTLTSTGLLCYAGHVCNYFQKSFEWFSELPSRIGNHSWFMIKRRRSINATASDTSQKKPTTANRHRLEAAFGELFEFMPNVYEGSRVDHAILAEYPADREQEMLDPIEPDGDLTGEVTVSKELFSEWLRTGSGTDACQCATAVMRYATDLQSSDLRGAVDEGTAWELCLRTLAGMLPSDATSFGSRTLSQLLVWWLDTKQLPSALHDQIYAGM